MFTIYTEMWVSYDIFIFTHPHIWLDNFCRQLSLWQIQGDLKFGGTGVSEIKQLINLKLIFEEVIFKGFMLKLALVKAQEELSSNYNDPRGHKIRRKIKTYDMSFLYFLYTDFKIVSFTQVFMS